MKIHTKTHTVISGGVATDMSKTDFSNSIVNYEISRYEIENCLTDRLVHDLRVDAANPLIYAGPGNVIFMVSGYDLDSREVYDIPEFVAFVRKANEATPCWMYHAAPESHWLQIVAFCALKSSYVSCSQPGTRTLVFSPHETVGFLDKQLDNCCELSIIAGVTEKKSKEHLKRVFMSFGIDLP
jgi:hypothetical protein